MILLLLLLLVTPAWSPVQLAWDYSDNPLAPASEFRVYRDTSCLNAPVILGTVPWVHQGTPTFTDSSAVPLTTYCYFVTARSAMGEESEHSNVLVFLVPDPTEELPFPPLSLRGAVIP
jgi:hypothetical protein